MNRDEIIRAMANRTACSIRMSEEYLDGLVELIKEQLSAGEKVQVLGFGTFEVKERAPRMGRNPKTNTPVPIPAKRAPVFKAGAKLKAAVEGR